MIVCPHLIRQAPILDRRGHKLLFERQALLNLHAETGLRSKD